jgi:hypothetical protein
MRRKQGASDIPPVLPFRVAFRFGTVVHDLLSESLIDPTCKNEMVRALYGLALYSQSVYLWTGPDLPRVEVTVESRHPLAIDEPDYLEGARSLTPSFCRSVRSIGSPGSWQA